MATLRLERDGPVARVILARPEVRNAFNAELIAELHDAFAGLAAEPAEALRDGRAMDAWRAMIAAQGGDPVAPLPQARETHTVPAPRSGVLTSLDALDVGVAAWRLGAGRVRPAGSARPATGASAPGGSTGTAA